MNAIDTPQWKPENEIDPRIARAWDLILRERQILGVHVVSPEGITSYKIGAVLGICTQTVNNNANGLRRKIEARGHCLTSTLDLIALYWLIEQKLIDHDRITREFRESPEWL